MSEKIAIGADHAGYQLKEQLKKYLTEKLVQEVEDVGTFSADSVDYPDFGGQVAEKVSTGQVPRGILVCSTGIGMSIVANKFPDVRAALCCDKETARLSRAHNNSNILVLGAKILQYPQAEEILDTWLKEPFAEDRHTRRINKIREIEKRLAIQKK